MSLQTRSDMTKNERRVLVDRPTDGEQVAWEVMDAEGWFGYALGKIAVDAREARPDRNDARGTLGVFLWMAFLVASAISSLVVSHAWATTARAAFRFLGPGPQ